MALEFVKYVAVADELVNRPLADVVSIDICAVVGPLSDPRKGGRKFTLVVGLETIMPLVDTVKIKLMQPNPDVINAPPESV